MESQVIYDVFHLNYWDWRVAFDLFFGGLGVGAYLFAVFVSWHYQDRFPEVSKAGALLAPLAVLLGLGFLILELGHPERMYLMLFSFHPASPLWWGGWCQLIFIGLSIRYLQLWYWGRPEEIPHRRQIGWMGVPFALIVGGYHGFLLTIVKAHPLWNAGPATVTAMLAFAICGIASVVLFLCLFFRKAETLLNGIQLARNVLGIAIVAQLFTIFLWAVSLANGPLASVRALQELNTHFGLLFWGGAVGLGLFLPLGLGLGAVIRERQQQTPVLNVAIPMVTSVLVLAGMFIFRYVILIAGQAF